MNTAIPTPAIMATRKKRLAASIDPLEPGTYRPGLVEEVVPGTHDGVIKTKQLVKGQRVRPFVHGKPRGGERIVESTEPLQNGSIVRVVWASLHAPSEHKAAYRWHDRSLVGKPIETVVQKPGLVAYQEV